MDRPRRVVAVLTAVLIAGCTPTVIPASPLTATPTAIASESSPSPVGIDSPSSDPSPSVGPVAATDLATARWTKLDVTGDAPGGIDLVGFDGGYVTLGTREPFEDPIASFTSDGSAWQAISLANLVPNCPGWGPEGNELVPDADVATIASNGHQVVVVGSFQPHDAASCATQGYTPVAWVSSDGRTWKRSQPFYGPGSQGRATAVWPIAGGWQAVAPSRLSGRPAIWQSADGLAWSQFADLGDRGFLGVYSGAAADGTTVVSGSFGEGEESSPQLASSRDGITWHPIDRAASCDTGPSRILPPSVEGSRVWIAMNDAQVCTSADLRQWSSATLPMAIWRVTQTRFGAIAIGDTCYGPGDQCPEEPVLKAFVSGDGVAWDALVHPPIAFGRAIADGPAGVLMIGTAPATQNTEAWRLDP